MHAEARPEDLERVNLAFATASPHRALSRIKPEPEQHGALQGHSVRLGDELAVYGGVWR